jgi:hypothetical protein
MTAIVNKIEARITPEVLKIIDAMFESTVDAVNLHSIKAFS